MFKHISFSRKRILHVILPPEGQKVDHEKPQLEKEIVGKNQKCRLISQLLLTVLQL